MNLTKLFRLLCILTVSAKADSQSVQGLSLENGKFEFYGVAVQNKFAAAILMPLLASDENRASAQKSFMNFSNSKDAEIALSGKRVIEQAAPQVLSKQDDVVQARNILSVKKSNNQSSNANQEVLHAQPPINAAELSKAIASHQAYFKRKQEQMHKFEIEFERKAILLQEVQKLAEQDQGVRQVAQDRALNMLIESSDFVKTIAPEDITLKNWILLQALEAGKVSANISLEDAQWLADFVQNYSEKLNEKLNGEEFDFDLAKWEILIKWNKKEKLNAEEQALVNNLTYATLTNLEKYMKSEQFHNIIMLQRLRSVGVHHFVYRYDGFANRAIYIGSEVLPADADNKIVNLAYYANSYNGSYNPDYPNSNNLAVEDLYYTWRNF